MVDSKHDPRADAPSVTQRPGGIPSRSEEAPGPRTPLDLDESGWRATLRRGESRRNAVTQQTQCSCARLLLSVVGFHASKAD